MNLCKKFDRAVEELTDEEIDDCRREAYTSIECDCPDNNCGAKMFEEVQARGGRAIEGMLVLVGVIPYEIVQSIMEKCVAKAEEKKLRNLTKDLPEWGLN